MEVRTADTASWITIKSNVCEMFVFDSFKRFSDLVEYRSWENVRFPQYLSQRQVLQRLISGQRDAGDNGKNMESPDEA